MRRALLLILGGTILIGASGFLIAKKFTPPPPFETKFILPEKPKTPQEVTVKQPGDFVVLPPPDSYRHSYQIFNNCGPATLSMSLSWYGVAKSQKELGEAMRPYQNPKGDNDDKTIFPEEFASWAEKYGFTSFHRVNGTIELLKLFLANDIPVVVKTWLRVNEDIGHFRLVRGFDEKQKVIIQDDSYNGPNKRISYFDFLSMWQPFNYGYIIVVPKEKESLVLATLGEEKDEKVAWQNANIRAQKEAELDPSNIYPWFNLSTSFYHLGEYQKSAESYELVEGKLPRRMLWYQIEPILSYKELKNYDQVFQITNWLFNNGNRAFAEAYLLRGEIYKELGNKEAARQELELALKYNKNLESAHEALKGL